MELHRRRRPGLRRHHMEYISELMIGLAFATFVAVQIWGTK